MSQETRILDLLKKGRKLTPLTALKAGCGLRLGARVHALRRKGWNIKTEMVNRSGARVAQYELTQ